jgi:C1A family cysteine protease
LKQEGILFVASATKTIVATLGASAALATAALHFNQATLESDILTEADYKFMEFITQHGRSYGTKAEFQFRSKVFKQTLSEIEAINAENGTHTVGINFLADRTPSERKRLNGYKGEKTASKVTVLDASNLADEVNWVTAGAVTPVKNQGQCGSCWSFSTTGAVEGAMFLKTGKLQSYSEQQLVDCSTSFGNMGCNGGLMDYAFTYIEKNPLEQESDYPYKAVDGKCSYVSTKGVGQVKSYTDVPTNSPTQLKAAIAKAPVSVAIEADQTAFQMYTSGVITKGCGQSLDHGVLAVGYGTLNGQGYFLVKNSWGASWGDKGYVRISDSTSNVCGILSAASYPTE